MKLNDTQQRAVDRLKKGLAAFKDKPSDVNKAMVARNYDNLLRNTLTASVLTKEETDLLNQALGNG